MDPNLRQQQFLEATTELMQTFEQLTCRINKHDRRQIKRDMEFFKVYIQLGAQGGADALAHIYMDIFDQNKLRILYDTSTQWMMFGTPITFVAGNHVLKVGEMCANLVKTYNQEDKNLIIKIDMLLSRTFASLYGYADEFEMLKTRIIAHETALGLRSNDDPSIPGLPGMVGYVNEMIDSNLPTMGAALPIPVVEGIRALQKNIKAKDLTQNPMQTMMDTVEETSQQPEGVRARDYVTG